MENNNENNFASIFIHKIKSPDLSAIKIRN